MSSPTTSDDSIKMWLKMGNMEKLEQAVLNGYGDQLRGKTSRIPRINNFLKQVPHFQSKIDAIHEAVAQGKLREVQSLMDRKKLAMSRTQTGASPLHTAVLHKQANIIKYILEKFPTAIQARDNLGRTPLHYAAVTADGGEMYKILSEYGADKKATDMRGKIPEYYLQNPEEMPLKSLREGATKVITRRNDRIIRPSEFSFSSVPSKLEIRTLIQKGDLHKLEAIVLNGYGDRLLGESSVNSRVSEFLNLIPEFMLKVAMLHAATVEGSLRDVRNLLDRRTLAVAKDPYGANVLHRAVVHNHHNIVKYLVENYPEAINATDADGRTPLHYSVAVEDERIYKTLIGVGADESIKDNKGKVAVDYQKIPLNISKVIQRDKILAARAKDKTPNSDSSVSTKTPSVIKRDVLQNGPLTSFNIRQMVRGSEVDKLEQLVLEGQGIKLLKESAIDLRTRTFLKKVPEFLSKIESLHEAVCVGNMRQVRTLLDRKHLVKSKDQIGFGLLHKSILFNHPHITRYFCQRYPEALLVKDNEGRTPLHFAAVIKDDGVAYHLLRESGADPLTVDGKGNTAIYYKEHPEELDLLEMQNRINRLRSKLQASKKSLVTHRSKHDGGFYVTRANIRKWIHAEDVDKLQQAVYEGHGKKLLVETSNSQKVKEFLKSVPTLIVRIKDVHQAVQNGNVKELEAKANNKQLYLSKDAGGLSPLHKAVILGNREISQFIINQCPDSVKAKDHEGRTALHFAAALPKDDGFIYNMLTNAGADTKQLDDRGKSPEYYQAHQNEAELKTILNRLSKKPQNHAISTNTTRRQQPPQTLNLRTTKNAKTAPFTTLSPEHVTKLINQGDIEKLEQLVLEGYGKKLYGKTSWIEEVRTFLRKVPFYMDRIYAVHTATDNGDLRAVEDLMTNKRLVIAKNDKGLTPLHRAVKFGKSDIVKYFVQMYPAAVHIKDNEGRTPLHFAGMYKDRDELYKLLLSAGSDPTITDLQNKTPEDYHQSNTKLETKSPTNATEGEEESNEQPSAEELEEEKNISEWIADGDIKNLEKLIINGQGELLLGKTSYNEPMQEFLEAVPASMGKIRAIHNAAWEGELRELQKLLDKKEYAAARDSLGACPLHKALLQGHVDIVRYLANNYPATLKVKDNEGRTALHYAAVAGDGGLYYRLLHKYGADPNIKDKNGSTPGHYLRGKGGPLSFEDLIKRYEEKKVPPRPASVQTWQRPPTEEILRALTPSPPPGTGDDEAHDMAPLGEDQNTGEVLLPDNEEGSEEKISDSEKIEPAQEEAECAPTDVETSAIEADEQNQAPAADSVEQVESPAVTADNPEISTDAEPESPAAENEPPATEDEPPATEDEPHASEDEPPAPEDKSPILEEPPTADEAPPPTEDATPAVAESSQQNEPDQTDKTTEETTEDSGHVVETSDAIEGEQQEAGKEVEDTKEENGNGEEEEENEEEESTEDASNKEESDKNEKNDEDEPPPQNGNNSTEQENSTVEANETQPDEKSDSNENANETNDKITQNDNDNEETTDAVNEDEPTQDNENSKTEENNDTPETEPGKETEITIKDEASINSPSTPNGMRTSKLSRNHSRQSVTSANPIMWTKEGEYLASVMGDALIKALTEVSHKRPKDPIGFLAVWLYLYAMQSTERSTSPDLDKEVDENDPLMNSTGLKKEEMEKGLYEARLAKSSGHRSTHSGQSNSSEIHKTARIKDDDGKTLLHFAAIRRHEGDAFWQLLFLIKCNPSERDDKYMTPRDIAQDANLTDNVHTIDRFVATLIINDKLDLVQELIIAGYDHILDVEDSELKGDIVEAVESRGQTEMLNLLNSVTTFQKQVQTINEAIEKGDLDKVKEFITNNDFALAKNLYARCSLHVAVLSGHVEVIEYIASTYPETLKAKDNMRRTPLHYAMGVKNSQKIAKILIQHGASRQTRDVRSRTPSYYFLRPQDIEDLTTQQIQAVEE